MPINFTLSSPDFDRIRRGEPRAIEDAIRLLWLAINEHEREMRNSVQHAIDQSIRRVFVSAPSAGQDNYSYDDAGVLDFNGATSVTITGFRSGFDGEKLLVLVTGSGTITIAHESASSEAANRIVTNTGANVAVTTNRAMVLLYRNSRWREFKPI